MGEKCRTTLIVNIIPIKCNPCLLLGLVIHWLFTEKTKRKYLKI